MINFALFAVILLQSAGNLVRFEQDTASVQYSGSWHNHTYGQHSGGSAVLGMDAGTKATFGFSGTSAKWIAYQDAWSGIARVYVDGVFKTEVDTFSGSDRAKAVAYSIENLASGDHALTIEVTGRRSPSSGGFWVWIDAFEAPGAGGVP